MIFSFATLREIFLLIVQAYLELVEGNLIGKFLIFATFYNAVNALAL